MIVKYYINHIKKEKDTTVYYRDSWMGDYMSMNIDKFLKLYGNKKIDINGNIYDEHDNIIPNFYIRKTG